MAVPISAVSELVAGTPQALFSLRFSPRGSNVGPLVLDEYDVSADGKRFVVRRLVGEARVDIRVVQNWYAEFRNHEQD